MRKILLVDDNPDLLDIAGAFFEAEGYVVAGALNAKMALQLCENFLPDVIISDYLMPDMNGADLLAQLRKQDNTKSIPFILLTGVISSKINNDEISIWLQKPIDLKVLQQKVQDLLT